MIAPSESTVKLTSTIRDNKSIRLNSKLLLRVISNLINNSMEACINTNADITITINETKESLEVYISDNGPGIPIEVANNLGKKFNTQNKLEGTGLGLHYAMKIIESWNGKLTIDKADSHGTRLKISFPFNK